MKKRLSFLVVAVAFAASVHTSAIAGGASVQTGAHVVTACPTPVPCVTNGPSCWAVNVKYTVNQAVGGPPDYATFDLWVGGMAFERRSDAECAAAELATGGLWLPPVDPALGVFVPPSRLDAVTIQDLYAIAN